MAPCPLCAAVGSSPAVERHGEFVLRWCRACDLQFADPMVEAGRDFYEGHALYAGPEVAYASPRALNWDQRCFLHDRPVPGGALLDVGCGTGQFMAATRRAGYRVTGLDPSRSQLDVARMRFGLTDLHAVTLAEYGREVPGASFDVITAFQVLEHVTHPLAFLAKARQLLRPGGQLAVGVPNWRMWSVLREPMDAPPNHLTRWSASSLRAALERSGFEVLREREHRSVYGFLLRHARLGLLRRAMSRSAISGAPAGAGRAVAPRPAILAASIVKTRFLMGLDLALRPALTTVRAPAVMLYALARAREIDGTDSRRAGGP
jgi:2-polyprenyl-3-methyl-5-hydroxy-6-metoxy-1,4-benzoquinol methylase